MRHGAYKLLAQDAQGRQRVAGFVLAGELLGLDGVYAHRHSCSAVALSVNRLCMLPYAELAELMGTHDPVRDQIMRLAGRDLEDKPALHASLTPEQRLARFLLDLSRRLGGHRKPVDDLTLPMSRQDIASYLGLATETVDHVFRQFATQSLLRFTGDEVKLLARGKLLLVAGSFF